ncbi:MAG TPA: tetratricopeptide repeat protein [Xanthobacteraceae bacterium]|nr:tetratricopeptide repeat protein [Xanthobacteraceae bacterium]
MKILSHLSFTVIAAAAFWAVPGAMAAQSPNPRDPGHFTPSGSYLAARQANLDRDPDAAATYYRAALKADQRNPELLELTFYSVLAYGEIDEAVRLAERLVQLDRNNRNAHLVLGVRSLKQKQWKDARAHFSQAMHGPVNDLTGTLLSAWSAFGANDVKGAVEAIDKLNGPEWYGIFKDMHAGLMFDLANNKKEAGKRLERAFKLDATALRIMQAQAGFLSRNGSRDEALKIYEEYDKQSPRYPLTVEALALLKKDMPLPRMVETAQAGAAEALYGLGAALGRREEEMSLANRGLAYLQLALYLEPNHALAQISLADLYEAMKKPELAIKIYERVPNSSPLKRNAEIQLANDLDVLERTEEAKKHLEKLIVNKPDDMEAIIALANIQRERKQYDGCADSYGKAADLITQPTKANWTIYYFRGICFERAKQWAKAEADFKRALELFPDQPHVLNYLGYSWIDQGIHLDEGMGMIKRSVEQRPDDGYIVDSLGWAYYRLGNYDEAVKNLERAVELKPVDPTINDHLGDVYWRVDRMLEAKFQWSHARDLKPEQEDLVKIEQKLKIGLQDEKSNSADADRQKKRIGGGG